tara:strand:+ start:196 stop:372 length:177 start_codon:yes stop_codon:yes gene_type:complete
MEEIFYAVGDFFESTFEIMPFFGDYLNYFYIFIISAFLVIWVSKMFVFRKKGEEHASS